MVCIGPARSGRPAYAALGRNASIKKYSKRNNLKCNYLNVEYLNLFSKTEGKMASPMKPASSGGVAVCQLPVYLLLFRKFE